MNNISSLNRVFYFQLGEKLQSENESPSIQRLTSLVWICTTTKSVSKVVIIDANNPGDILHMFTVCQAHLLCIASVPGIDSSLFHLSYSLKNSLILTFVWTGATESDYSDAEPVSEDENVIKESSIPNGECDSDREKSLEQEKDLVIGKVSFVSCATGSEEPPASPTEQEDDVSDDTPKEFGNFATIFRYLLWLIRLWFDWFIIHWTLMRS